MSDADASSLSFWSALSLIGLILVIVGVLFEGAEASIWTFSWSRRRRLSIIWSVLPEPHIPKWAHRLDHVGWFILVIGLALETWGHIRVTDITGRENRRLTVKLDSATKSAAEANELAARIGTTNAELVASNMKLFEYFIRLDVENMFRHRLELPRALRFNKTNFLSDLKGRPKGSANISYLENNQDAHFLSGVLVSAMREAGWTAPEPTPITLEQIEQIDPLPHRIGLLLIANIPFGPKYSPVVRPDELKPGEPAPIDGVWRADTPEETVRMALMESGLLEGRMFTNSLLHSGEVQIVIEEDNKW